MEPIIISGGSWWLHAIPVFAEQGRSSLQEAVNCYPSVGIAMAYISIFVMGLLVLLLRWAVPGGPAWWAYGRKNSRNVIPGPRGWPVIGSLFHMRRLAHRALWAMSVNHQAEKLMAFSLGNTRVVIASRPEVARELLCSPALADRPLKESAKQLMFERAIGFAPHGEYWRRLRRIAATHLFSPSRVAAQEPARQVGANHMLVRIAREAAVNRYVMIRSHLQSAALDNIMNSVFGRASLGSSEGLAALVAEGFELLGAFNWSDHLPCIRIFGRLRNRRRCEALALRVRAFVQAVIDDHRTSPRQDTSDLDFVDALLSLNGDDKLEDEDIVAVLWEMIFRGTDTTALLTEWAMSELVLHPEVQHNVHLELDAVVGNDRSVTDADILKMPYLQAVVKETLRLHPPGPLLSWARMATEDVCIAGKVVPEGTTAMVNMWAITHSPEIWSVAGNFLPERFILTKGGEDVDLRGNDLRLAPFGAGRRVCPGKALGLATVQLWLAKLLHHFIWLPSSQHPVQLSEVLKLSCEMLHPLVAVPVPRIPLPCNLPPST